MQSAVSQQIAVLERAVGTRLVDRTPGPKPVTLTDAGRILLCHADDILARISAARADMHTIADGGSGQLRVGIANPLACRLLARVVAEFARQRPNVRIVPHELGDDRLLLEQVEHGEIDAGFVEPPVRHGPFTVIDVLSDPHVLLVHEASDLAALGRALTADDLIGREVIVGDGSKELIGALRARRILLDPLSNCVTDRTAQSLVSGGAGVAIVPRLAGDPPAERTLALSLDGAVPPRRIAVCWHAERQVSESVTAFAQAALAACRELGSRDPAGLAR